MSNLINKVKDKMSSNKDDNNYASDNYGSHSSNAANKADPRFDSDLDNRNNPSSRVGGLGNTQDTYGSGTTSGYGNDSTLGGQGASTGYGSGATSGYGNDSSLGGQGTTSGYGTGTTHDQTTGGGTYDNPRSTNAGPHGSNMTNKMDPRVDSDMDNRNNPSSRVGGYGQTQDNYGSNTGAGYGDSTLGGQGSTYGGSTTGGAGYGDSTLGGGRGNTYGDSTTSGAGYGDSTLGGGQGNTYGDSTSGGAGYGDSSLGGRGDTYGDSATSGAAYNDRGGNYSSSATPGSGNTAQTAGPHNNNLMNKLDPRVDSDMDGSKTYGGNKTSY